MPNQKLTAQGEFLNALRECLGLDPLYATQRRSESERGADHATQGVNVPHGALQSHDSNGGRRARRSTTT